MSNKVVALIQARDNSSRLPKKATMDLCGKTVIHHLWDRLQAVGSLDGVAVSTSKDSPEVIGWCKVNEIPYHAGSEDDLLARHLGAAVQFKADAILRVTADCPFHDPEMLENMVSGFKEARSDALINWHLDARSVSEGLDAAIVSVKTMRHLFVDPDCPREDWLTYLDKRTTRYRVMGWAYPQRVGHDLHLSIDTQEDLDRARKMMALLGNETRYELTLSAYEVTK